jgi:hypothetical protein
MAKFILKDAYCLLNAVNLSSNVSKVEIDTKADDGDVTAMGDTGHRHLPGLRDESVKITFKQDYAAANVDATLWPLYSGQTSFAVEFRPTSGARSATNPAWTGTCYLMEYKPIAGGVGDVAETDVSLVVDGVLTRQTS